MEIVITGVDATIDRLQKEMKSIIQNAAQEVFVAARANTPVKTGYARSKWSKTVSEKNFEVSNKVPYIQRLEAGASKQAPRGIIGPTLEQIKGKV
jgi:HK97 gp10 family phage protein